MSTSPRKRPASEAIIAGGVVVLLIVIVALVFLSGFGNSLFPPPPVTDRAHETSQLYNIVFALATAVFVAVEGLIVWSILRYRRRPTDIDLPPQTHGNNLVEVLWTAIPTVIVLILFFVSWDTLNKVDATSLAAGQQPDVRVHAIAGQFQWQFEYLDADGNHVATQTTPLGGDAGGGMAVPVGKKVYVTLDSGDVIHAWYVPRFLFKRDVVPGQQNHFEFTVDTDEAGQTFHGQCAELCGEGHNKMHFDVHAMAGADFDTWLQQKIAAANASPSPAPPQPSGGSNPPGQSGPPAAAPLSLVAQNIAYDKTELSAPANTPFQIQFDNQDASIPHNVAIHEGSPTGAEIFKGEIFPGPAQKTYDVPPLKAGAYAFVCSVHPNMNGTLTVQ
jgi:cytochrome c oxidase subunit 2